MHKRIMTAILCFLCTAGVYAQTGKISGKVTDRETGEPLIGANVRIEGTQRGAATNLNGEYVILNVPIGKVTLVATYVGYQSITIKDVLVRSDETSMKDFQLPSDAYKVEEVVITAQKPLVDKNVTNSKATVTQEDIKDLPVVGIESIVSQQAGIVNSGGIHVRGGRSDATGYIVDGIAVNNPLVGGRALTVINNAIAEINFQAGGYSAEFGGANAGLIATTTRSGGRKLQVGFEAYTNNFAKPGNSYLGTYSSGSSTYILTVGGPVYGPVKFFVAAQNSFSRTGIGSFQSPYTITQMYSDLLKNTPQHALLAPAEQAKVGIFDPQQGPSAQVYDFSWPAAYAANAAAQSWSGNGNLTIDLNPVNIRLGGSYSRTWGRGGVGVFTKLDEPRASYTQSENLSANMKLTHLLSPNTFYELYLNYIGNFNLTMDYDLQHNLVGYGDSVANAQYGYTFVSDYIPPQPISMYDVSFTKFGTPLTNYGKTRWNSIQAKMNFVHQIGRTHEIKFGGEFMRYTVRSFGIDAIDLWSYLVNNPDATPNDQAVGSRTNFYGYDQYGVALDSGPDGPEHPIFAAAYALDKIELEDLVINFGVRYDYINTNSKQPKDLHNVHFKGGNLDPDFLVDAPVSQTLSPRLGFSFPVTDQTVFYAQYGKFVQQSRLLDIYEGRAITASNIRGGYAIQNPIGFGLKPERTTQYDFGFRQQVGENFAFDIGAYYKDIRDQVQQRQITASPGASHTAYYALVNGDFATTSGISLKLDLRRVERLQASVDYTYSDARGTGSAPNDAFYAIWQSPTSLPYFPKYTTPLDFDQTHKGSINVDYRFAKDDGPVIGGLKIFERVGLNLLFSFNSGTRYTMVDQNSYGNRRQPIEQINESTTPWVFQLDGRLDKTVSIGTVDVNFYLWVVNIFNIKNVTGIFIQSGSWTDNGWLSTDEGQKRIANYASYGNVFANVYKDVYYQANLMNAGQYGASRQIYLGMRVDL